MTTPVFPRETIEFLPVTVTINGAPVTTGVTFSKTVDPARPTVWTAAVISGAQIGVQLSGEAVGLHTVYAKITGAGETPVIDCGQYRIN